MTQQDNDCSDSRPSPESNPGGDQAQSIHSTQLPVPVTSDTSYLQQLTRYLELTLSIPERTARAACALIGGTTLLLTKTLLPDAVKTSSTYHFTLGMFQTFLVRNVAGMDRGDLPDQLQDRFVHRKMLGTSLEAAGLFTMHISPVWVFAIASDTARGGQVFLNRLVHYLKEHNVISKDASPANLEQVLQAIQDMSHRGAQTIDTPPLSRDEISALADELRSTTARLSEHSSELLPRFEDLWNQISLVARKENLSMEQVLGLLSVNASNAVQQGVGTANAVTRTGFHILNEMVLTDYRKTLNGISEEGSLAYMQNHMRPFLGSAQLHFDFSRETWTQRMFKNVIQAFASKLRRESPRDSDF